MDGTGGENPIVAEFGGHLVDALFGLAKDEDAGAIVDLAEEGEESLVLFFSADHFDFLYDCLVCRQLWHPNLHMNWLQSAKRPRQLLHFLRPRRRKHQRLPVRSNLLRHLANLPLKAHILNK